MPPEGAPAAASEPGPDPSQVDVSVVVPTRDRPDQLDRCLTALSRQDIDASFEVVVVDDGGEIPARPVVDRHADLLRVVARRQAGQGPAAARNAGASQASGRFLAFTDDDCAPAPGWLSALVAALGRHHGDLVAGRTVNAIDGNAFAHASQSVVAYLDRDDHRRNGDLAFATSNNLAVDTAAFRAIGGFDASFPLAAAEDRDLCDRWRLAGGALVRAPDAVVYHRHQMGLAGFWRQHVRYGRGARHYHQARAARGQPRLVVESPGFYAGMLLSPFAGDGASRGRVRSSALVGLSQIATAVGFVAETGGELARRVVSR